MPPTVLQARLSPSLASSKAVLFCVEFFRRDAAEAGALALGSGFPHRLGKGK